MVTEQAQLLVCPVKLVSHYGNEVDPNAQT